MVARFLSRWFLREHFIIRCQINRKQIYEQDILVTLMCLAWALHFRLIMLFSLGYILWEAPAIVTFFSLMWNCAHWGGLNTDQGNLPPLLILHTSHTPLGIKRDRTTLILFQPGELSSWAFIAVTLSEKEVMQPHHLVWLPSSLIVRSWN